MIFRVSTVFFYKSNLLLSVSALKFDFFFPAVNKNKYFSKMMQCATVVIPGYNTTETSSHTIF